MKQFSLFFISVVLFSTQLIAQKSDAVQQGVPQGMKYQAVARGIAGEILAEKTVNLQINLGSKSTNFYAEKHTAFTVHNKHLLLHRTITSTRTNRAIRHGY